MKYDSNRTSGQVMITMLYVMVIGLLVTTGAAMAVIANTQAASTFELGEAARNNAENGVENAILRIIRNPSYTGETVTFATDSTAVISVSETGGMFTITSTGTYASVSRQLEATMHYNNGTLVFDSWKELP